MRAYLRPQEMYKGSATPEILAPNPERFATLVGQRVLPGWKEEGPDHRRGYIPGTVHPFD